MAGQNSAKDSYNKNANAQKAAARLPELELEARNLASLIHGLRQRTKAGAGTEFHAFRPFQNGIDNPHKIDWKSSARRVDHEGNDALQMRDREMEVAQQIYIWRDGSKSMNFKAPADLFPDQPEHNKKEAADILTMATAYLALKAGERFTLLGSDMKMSGNKNGIDRIRTELERDELRGTDQELPKLFVHRGKRLPTNSHVFIFSDFLCPLKDIAEMIDSLHAAGVKGHLVQILDPAEVEFRYQGHVKLEGMEGEGSYTIKKGESSRHEIEQRIHKHVNDIEQMVKKIPGWNYSTYVTDQPLYEGLLPLYNIKTNRMPRPTASAAPKDPS